MEETRQEKKEREQANFGKFEFRPDMLKTH